MENIYDVLVWGRVVVQGEEFYLLSPRPYSSEVVEKGVSRSVWQLEGSLKWEVAGVDDYVIKDGESFFKRSIIVFGSNVLLEFYQDPQTIKVKYVTPEQDDEVN